MNGVQHHRRLFPLIVIAATFVGSGMVHGADD